MEAAGGDAAKLEELAARRVAGEPLAWVTGRVDFAGVRVRVERGVYVPRHESAILVSAAVEVLPTGGAAVDLCTGSGAVALALSRRRPGARVAATDIDPAAYRCARLNGVDAYQGDLDEPLPDSLRGTTDVVTAVAPYVPTGELDYLPRDSREFEPLGALDGGTDGLDVLSRVVAAAARLLRPGGSLVVELGAGQDRLLTSVLSESGFGAAEAFYDDDGDLRAVRARRL